MKISKDAAFGLWFFFKLFFLHMFCKQQIFLYESPVSLAISAAVSRLSIAFPDQPDD